MNARLKAKIPTTSAMPFARTVRPGFRGRLMNSPEKSPWRLEKERRKTMRGTATLESLFHRTLDMSTKNHDEVIPVMDMQFDNLEKMWVAGQPVEVLPSAQRLFAKPAQGPVLISQPLSGGTPG